MERANPFANLDEFQAKLKPKQIEKAQIEQLAAETGFPSRQPAVRTGQPTATQPDFAKKRRRYTTGRNKQINIKATDATIERLYKLADARHVPLGEVLELALDALDRDTAAAGTRL